MSYVSCEYLRLGTCFIASFTEIQYNTEINICHLSYPLGSVLWRSGALLVVKWAKVSIHICLRNTSVYSHLCILIRTFKPVMSLFSHVLAMSLHVISLVVLVLVLVPTHVLVRVPVLSCLACSRAIPGRLPTSS